MKNLIFLDVETTGVGEKDRICQVAYQYQGVNVESLFCPPLPIGLVATSITHITNDMVADRDPFCDSAIAKELKEYANDGAILVAHNSQFDLGMLNKEDIYFPANICTYKVAQDIDDGEMEKHNLQYLRYFFDLKFSQEINPHDAMSDVLVLIEVFKELRNLVANKYDLDLEGATAKMIEITVNPVLMTKFNFGKYNGRLIREILDVDRGYLEWLMRTKMEKPQGEENWIYTLQTYLYDNQRTEEPTT